MKLIKLLCTKGEFPFKSIRRNFKGILNLKLSIYTHSVSVHTSSHAGVNKSLQFDEVVLGLNLGVCEVCWGKETVLNSWRCLTGHFLHSSK